MAPLFSCANEEGNATALFNVHVEVGSVPRAPVIGLRFLKRLRRYQCTNREVNFPVSRPHNRQSRAEWSQRYSRDSISSLATVWFWHPPALSLGEVRLWGLSAVYASAQLLGRRRGRKRTLRSDSTCLLRELSSRQGFPSCLTSSDGHPKERSVRRWNHC